MFFTFIWQNLFEPQSRKKVLIAFFYFKYLSFIDNRAYLFVNYDILFHNIYTIFRLFIDIKHIVSKIYYPIGSDFKIAYV